MKLALDVARPDDKGWIDNAYEEALLTATQEEEAAARQLADNWRKAYGSDSTGATPLMIPTPPVTPAPAPAMATPVPPPVRAPGAQPQAPRQLVKPIEQQSEFNTLPTNMQVPNKATPPAE
jgi:hypothetical protein